jgi:hypothetical protein
LALSGLTSRVSAAEGNITSTSGQVTSLSNTLATTTGTANAAQTAAQAASDLAGGKGKVIYSATAPAVADRQTQTCGSTSQVVPTRQSAGRAAHGRL